MPATPLHVCLPALALLAALGTALPAEGRVLEEEIDVPVRVQDHWGKTVEQTIRVTVFTEDSDPGPKPVLVLNHGRAADALARAAMGRARYAEAARFFVGLGFLVAVPTRVGYGASGGEDVEHTGTCARRNYPPGYAAAAQQSLAVLEAVRHRPDAAPDRAVVAGQSFGGTTAVGLAALNPPGVQAAINFAGGGGGNPKLHPRQPCAQPALEQLFRGYGRTARIPTLWIYAENDMYFGPSLPRQWHQAFSAAGGSAELVQYPPQGEDGHALFTRFPQVWQPKVREFLDALGFRPRAAKGTP